MAAALLSLLLAPLVFAMAREMFGTAAAFLALALLAFDPNILAHGALVTTDEYGIPVFDGSFDIPRVAALNHAARAWQLGGEKHPEEALAEAQVAERLAPRIAMTHVCLGDALWDVNRRDESRQEYRDAITMAQTVEPELQKGWIPHARGLLERK
jgi:tetratricopeptide (TPR) repeat protein